MTSLRERLARKPILLAPGVHDALSALVAEKAGAEAVYLSGASIAYTRLGRPDIGLVSMAEVADTLALIRDRVALPLIVDADDGFGNALNVQRTVRAFERAGANALQIGDQAAPKRCGRLSGKALVSPGAMLGKIAAALDARASEHTLIVARTDAIAVEGLDPALDRAAAYADAGADVIFVEAPRDTTEMTQMVERLDGYAPLMAEMAEGGRTPLFAAAELERLGFAVVIFPGGLIRAVGKLMTAYFESLIANGTTAPLASEMLDADGLDALVGTPEMLAAGDAYDPERFDG